jgi:hypothetical protein
MWEILIFKVISATKNSNKFQKTRFWKEKSAEDRHLGEGTGHTSCNHNTQDA